MNLRDIEYIISAATHKNFAKAAQECHISQPSLSIQIKKVERQLGKALFVREQRGVRLSEFGEQVLPHLQAVLMSVGRVRALAAKAEAKSKPVIKLGAIATVAPYVFPHLKDLEGVRLEEAVTTELVKKLLDQKIDAALLALPVKIPSLTSMKLYKEPFYLAGAKRNRALGKVDLETPNFPADCRFLVLSDEHCMGEQTVKLCQLDTGSRNDVVQEASLETIRQMAASSKDVTLIPALARRKNDGLTYKTLPEQFYREIGIVYDEKNPRLPQIQDAYDYLKALPIIQQM